MPGSGTVGVDMEEQLMSDLTAEVTELLQGLIRNRCVNDGSPDSGGESRNADLLAAYLDGAGLEFRRFEPRPGRASLVVRLEGTDPAAPTLLLMGHTDVVPANPADWSRDPFGGELVDGEVWGRGAVDMLSLTASMAVATRHAATEGPRLRGTLLFLGVADEESGGTWGARWLLDNVPDAVRADYVVTEAGGFRLPLPSASPGPILPVMVGEKGIQWLRLVVRGRAGHGSMPFRTDNAAVKAAEVVRRIADHAPRAVLHDIWRSFVTQADLPAELVGPLLDPDAIDRFLQTSPDLGLARTLHALTHTTISPTAIHSGSKTNIIPDQAQIDLDIRTLPGQTPDDIVGLVRDALGDLASEVEMETLIADQASASPADSPLFAALERGITALVPGARALPFMIMGGTDARFFRRHGAVAYGAGLFSDRVPAGEFMRMFHGPDERIDQESLRLSAELWRSLASDLLDGPASVGGPR